MPLPVAASRGNFLAWLDLFKADSAQRLFRGVWVRIGLFSYPDRWRTTITPESPREGQAD